MMKRMMPLALAVMMYICLLPGCGNKPVDEEHAPPKTLVTEPATEALKIPETDAPTEHVTEVLMEPATDTLTDYGEYGNFSESSGDDNLTDLG